MKTKILLCLGLAVALAALSADYRGKESCLYKIDEANKTLTVMGETAYDPKTDEGTSIYQIKWNDETDFTNYKLKVPLDQVKPGSTALLGLNAKNTELLLKGRPFTCTVIVYDVEKPYKWDGKGHLITKIWPTGKFARGIHPRH